MKDLNQKGINKTGIFIHYLLFLTKRLNIQIINFVRPKQMLTSISQQIVMDNGTLIVPCTDNLHKISAAVVEMRIIPLFISMTLHKSV